MLIKPDTLRITPEILSLIAEIDEFKGAWRALGTLAPDRLSALRRVATIESIGSSTRIEGSRLTDREVELLLGNLEMSPTAPLRASSSKARTAITLRCGGHRRRSEPTIRNGNPGYYSSFVPCGPRRTGWQRRLNTKD